MCNVPFFMYYVMLLFFVISGITACISPDFVASLLQESLYKRQNDSQTCGLAATAAHVKNLVSIREQDPVLTKNDTNDNMCHHHG